MAPHVQIVSIGTILSAAIRRASMRSGVELTGTVIWMTRPAVWRTDEIRQFALEQATVVVSWVRKIGAGLLSSRSSRSRMAAKYSVLSWSTVRKW